MLSSSTVLDVMMGERKPTIGKVGKGNVVEGVAGKHCQFDVAFNVEGKKQSDLNVKILGNDGKELKPGQDINISITDGKISVDVLNPKRAKSGNFKVVVGNAQGEAEQDVNVNIMDKPATPGSCTVSQVTRCSGSGSGFKIVVITQKHYVNSNTAVTKQDFLQILIF